MQRYVLNDGVKVDVLQPGLENAPVIIIEGALQNIQELIDYACTKSPQAISKKEFPAHNAKLAEFAFHSGRALYPGVCRPTPQAYREFIFREVMPLVADIYKLSQHKLSSLSSDYSIVSSPPSELQLKQRIPHHDGSNHQEIAMIHFLCDERLGGTSLYRHRKTGFEFISQARKDHYLSVLDEQLTHADELDHQHYINGSSKLFERYFQCSAGMDKLFIYPCPLLHSGDISKDYLVADSPRDARLTITNFLFSKS